MVRFKEPVRGNIRSKAGRSAWLGPATVEGSTRHQQIQIRYGSRTLKVAKRNVRALPIELLGESNTSKITPCGSSDFRSSGFQAPSAKRKRQSRKSESPEPSEWYLEQLEQERYIEQTSLPPKHSYKVARSPTITKITRLSSPVPLTRPKEDTAEDYTLIEQLDENIRRSLLAEPYTFSHVVESEMSQVDYVLVGGTEPAYRENDFVTRLSVEREPSWGTAYTVNLSGHHLFTVMTSSQCISDVVVEAFMAIAEKSDPDIHRKYAGFEDPGVLALLQDSGEAVQRIKAAISGEFSRTCAQPLCAAGHFVTAVKRPESDVVQIFNSLNGCLPEFLLLQIYVIFGDGVSDLKVEVPRTAKQSPAGNVCAVMACAFAADIFTGESPNDVQYASEDVQRLWLLYCLQQRQLSACPRLNLRNCRKVLTSPAESTYTITALRASVYLENELRRLENEKRISSDGEYPTVVLD